MAGLEKWINELQIAVADLFRKIDTLSAGAASALKPTITDPEDGQAIVYDATTEKWVNGSVTPPAPEPAQVLNIIEQSEGISEIVAPIYYSEDGTTTVMSDSTNGEFVRIKTGAGAFTSYVRSGVVVDLSIYKSMKIKATHSGQTREDVIDLSSYGDIQAYIGVFYSASSQSNIYGYCICPKNTPQFLEKYTIVEQQPLPGTIDVYELSFSQPASTNNKRRKTK